MPPSSNTPTATEAMCIAKTGSALGSLGVPRCSAQRECSRRGRASVSFGSTAIRGDITETEGAFGPLGVTKWQAKKEYTATATAITNFGASTRPVNASK